MQSKRMFTPLYHKLVNTTKVSGVTEAPANAFDAVRGADQPILIITPQVAATFIQSPMPTDEEMEQLENEGAFLIRIAPKIY